MAYLQLFLKIVKLESVLTEAHHDQRLFLALLRHYWNVISIINMLYKSYYSFPSKHTLKIIPPLSFLFPLSLLEWLCNWFWPARCKHMCYLSHLGRSFKSRI